MAAPRPCRQPGTPPGRWPGAQSPAWPGGSGASPAPCAPRPPARGALSSDVRLPGSDDRPPAALIKGSVANTGSIATSPRPHLSAPRAPRSGRPGVRSLRSLTLLALPPCAPDHPSGVPRSLGLHGSREEPGPAERFPARRPLQVGARRGQPSDAALGLPRARPAGRVPQSGSSGAGASASGGEVGA